MVIQRNSSGSGKEDESSINTIQDLNSFVMVVLYLEKRGDSIDVDSQDEEIGFVCLKGNGNIKVEGKTFSLRKYDALYIPRENRCSIYFTGSL